MTFATASIVRSCTAQCRIDSPLGPLLLARTPAGLAGRGSRTRSTIR